MATHYISGRGTGRGTTGPSMPVNDSAGYLVRGRGTARPCDDRPSMPANDPSTHLVHGRGIWRAPCDEAEPCNCEDGEGLYDDFEREIGPSEGWGTATPAEIAYLYGGPGTFGLSVADGVGRVLVSGGDSQLVQVRIPKHCRFTQATGFILRFEFKTAPVVTSPIFMSLHTPGIAPVAWSVDITAGDSEGSLQISSDPGIVDVAKTDWVADTWYGVKVEYRPGDVMRLRVWPLADVEPFTWDLELTDTDVAGPLNSSFEWNFLADGGTYDSFLIDNFMVSCFVDQG